VVISPALVAEVAVVAEHLALVVPLLAHPLVVLPALKQRVTPPLVTKLLWAEAEVVAAALLDLAAPQL
jgi:hypothetical protein